jgi:hypothetical protein
VIAIRPSNQPVPLAQTGELDATLAEHREFVRSHLRLRPDDVVLISALTCTQPGCPPVETVVVVLDDSHRKWTFPLPPHELTTDQLRQQLTDTPEGHPTHD